MKYFFVYLHGLVLGLGAPVEQATLWVCSVMMMRSHFLYDCALECVDSDLNTNVYLVQSCIDHFQDYT